MQIYFHSCLCSYLPRVPILVEDTVNVYPIQLKIKIKNTNYTNYANASHKYCTCAERNIVSQQLAGEQYKMIYSSA